MTTRSIETAVQLLRLWIFVGIAFLLAGSSSAEVTLPAILDHHMVLQQGQRVPIWGWADPEETVTVEFDGQRRKTKADPNGRWSVNLRSLKASVVPDNLVVQGANRIVLTNILVGEVWLCSGQSNMEKPIGAQRGQKPVPNHEQELAESDYPLMRLFKVEKAFAATPRQDLKGSGWHLSNSNSHEALKFSAAAYFFGRDIHRELNVPVGLIESAWGGTRIEPWTPPVGFSAVPELEGLIDIPEADAEVNNRTPTALYNSMIAPLVPFAFRGALWYQGESNCMDDPDGAIYTDKMVALVQGWRKVWGQGRFPFYYVQLAPYRYYSDRDKPRVPSPQTLPEMWEAQTDALRIPNTGMIVTTDLVDDIKDIHPCNKQDIGKRLALLALVRDYGRRDTACSGPMFRKVKFTQDNAIVTFDHAEGGLVSSDGQPLSWFTIAGPDGQFVPATAVIDGRTVIVSSPTVAEPEAVRFGWHEKAMPNLFNKGGLPAVPFRTDRPTP